MNHALLRIVANVALGNIPSGADAAFPQWDGPDATTVRVQAVLYSSLAITILAAFFAVLGKQWLNRYAQVEMRGSVIDRSRYRQRKMDGMDTWHFDLVMECLPLMLQAAILLISCALSDYLYLINKVVASVIIGITAFGLLFYILIISAATLSFNCPFQTPPSLIFRYLIRFDEKHRKYLKRTGRWIRHIFSQGKKLLWRKPGGPHGATNMVVEENPVGHIELQMPNQSNHLGPLFTKDTDWENYVLDSNCIAWMFKMCTDADFVIAIMKFIPEVVWHADIHNVPLEKLYDTFVGCFDCSSGCHVLIPKLKDKAYLSAKALLHLAVQRKCIGGGSNEHFESISEKYLRMRPKPQNCYSDLESTLCIIDRVFGGSEPIHWQDFSFSVPHHVWIGHILVYHAWEALEKEKLSSADIKGFISYSSQLQHLPVMADCFILIGFLLGLTLHRDDLSTVDKR